MNMDGEERTRDMVASRLSPVRRDRATWWHGLASRLWVRPGALTYAAGTGTDLARSGAQLLAENALLRQQVIVLRRSVKRPALRRMDRALVVVLAALWWLLWPARA